MKENILQLLASGLRPADVARELGISEGYISQLLKDKEFASALHQMQLARASALIEHDKKLDSLESTLANKAEELAPFLTTPGQVFKALQIVNGLKRRAPAAVDSNSEAAAIVQISLPPQLFKTFNITLDSLNNIQAVDGREMKTLEVHDVVRLAEKPKQLSHPDPLDLIPDLRADGQSF